MKAGQCLVVLIGGLTLCVYLVSGEGCTIDYLVVGRCKESMLTSDTGLKSNLVN